MDNMVKKQGFFVPAGTPQVSAHPQESRELLYNRIIIRFIKMVMKGQGLKLYVFGSENVPTTGGALLAVNHTGYYDFILGGIPAHLRGKRLTRFMAKKEIFDTPVVGQLMQGMSHIPVNRAKGAGSLENAVKRLQQGQLVGIFPEATISRSFEIKEFKTGTTRMAHDAGVPVIPVTIFGSQRVWTKGHKKNLGRVKAPVWLRVGKPFTPGPDPVESTRELSALMEKQLDQLKVDYIERYGDEPGAYWLPVEMGGSAPTLEEANVMDAKDREAREAKRAEKLRALGAGDVGTHGDGQGNPADPDGPAEPGEADGRR